MNTDLKKQLYPLLAKLSSEEKRAIISYLEGSCTSYGKDLSNMVSEIRKKHFSSGYNCFNYASSIRYGIYRNRQCYLCKTCKKTFTDLRSTALHRIHDKEKFFCAAKLMLYGATLERIAEEVDINIATFGRPSADEIDRLLGDRLTEKSVLLTDRHSSFGRFAKNRGLNYINLDLKGGRKTIRGIYYIYHTQHVNSYHSRLKNWIARFKGVATRYLSNYLHWVEFIDTVAKDKTREAAGRVLLLRACSIKAV